MNNVLETIQEEIKVINNKWAELDLSMSDAELAREEKKLKEELKRLKVLEAKTQELLYGLV